MGDDSGLKINDKNLDIKDQSHLEEDLSVTNSELFISQLLFLDELVENGSGCGLNGEPLLSESMAPVPSGTSLVPARYPSRTLASETDLAASAARIP